MTELSPAAQAVIDAAMTTPIVLGDYAATRGRQIAAALRSAADQVLSDVTPPVDDHDEHSIGFAAAHRKYRRDLLAIATELEAQP
jgi:hypothetical protein